MPLTPPSWARICLSASNGPEYVWWRGIADWAIKRVRTRSRGERRKPVMICDATGKIRGGRYSPEADDKKTEWRRLSTSG